MLAELLSSLLLHLYNLAPAFLDLSLNSTEPAHALPSYMAHFFIPESTSTYLTATLVALPGAGQYYDSTALHHIAPFSLDRGWVGTWEGQRFTR